jgi:hypothetical protein
MRATRTLASLGLLLLLLGAGCGKDGGGGSPPTVSDPTVPVITNFRASFGAPCQLGSASNRGTIETLTFEYADADGNVRGGILENRTSADTGGPFTFTPRIPSPGVTITGTTSGTISATACLHFGSNANVKEEVRITDASGKVSNVLTITVSNPGGLPLVPHGAEAPARKAMEPGK